MEVGRAHLSLEDQSEIMSAVIKRLAFEKGGILRLKFDDVARVDREYALVCGFLNFRTEDNVERLELIYKLVPLEDVQRTVDNFSKLPVINGPEKKTPTPSDYFKDKLGL